VFAGPERNGGRGLRALRFGAGRAGRFGFALWRMASGALGRVPVCVLWCLQVVNRALLTGLARIAAGLDWPGLVRKPGFLGDLPRVWAVQVVGAPPVPFDVVDRPGIPGFQAMRGVG